MIRNIIFICLIVFFYSLSYADSFLPNATYSVCFTLRDNCTSKVVEAIFHANKQIFIQAYSFTSIPIAEALIHAKNRGLDIRILLDKSQLRARNSVISLFENNGIKPSIDYKPSIAHNKIMVIDNKEVITGSFNFTKAAAEKNAENLLIIEDVNLAHKYEQNWYQRAKQSITADEYRKHGRRENLSD